ncbi:MAG: ABC transporter permease [Actinomycetota bacterium]
MSVTPTLGPELVIALLGLLALAVGVAWIGRLPVGRPAVTAAVRAAVQLALVAVVIAAVLDRVLTALFLAIVMFAVAATTAAGRVAARRDVAWIALALVAGVVPVLVVIFGSGATEFTGPAIVPIAGIIIGGSMTAHTLMARRAFDSLRADHGQVEAALALGMDRADAISLVISRHSSEALHPALDQTRTVGLVTLPGAFVGVLLGGGSAGDAAAAQLLVLIGLLASETSVVEASRRLIARGRILPDDVRRILPAK